MKFSHALDGLVEFVIYVPVVWIISSVICTTIAPAYLPQPIQDITMDRLTESVIKKYHLRKWFQSRLIQIMLRKQVLKNMTLLSQYRAYILP